MQRETARKEASTGTTEERDGIPIFPYKTGSCYC
ncbi:uncharacterized protein G2W53_011052 [Senna tora]|uniref:Uncharacterized protein n=1 Tax=Senna tora TaxID=362788 RepID=A0A834X122_9FABA|nr:uncharacterized protein G2W53_011052 [Senna tora]